MRRWIVAGLLVALGGAACGEVDKKVGPQAGDITLALTTSRTETGALLLRVVGPVEEIAALGGLRAGSAPLGTGATRVVLTGSITSGDILRLRIPDLDLAETYTVQVEQAALGTTFALVEPGEYSVVVRR